MGNWCHWCEQPSESSQCCLYLNGINFTIRGGAEHRNLCLSQLTFGKEQDPNNPNESVDYVEYTEFGSKNRPGGRKQLNLTNKSVRYYSQPSLGNCCHVQVLQFYISKLPQAAVEKDIFYCKPIKKKKDEKLWYCAVSLGHNTLDKKLKEIFALANLDPDGKSNHSLCAMCHVSHLFQGRIMPTFQKS